MPILKSQLARYIGGLPLYATPALTGVPYLAPDLQVGDVVDFVFAPITSVVYPTPSTTSTIFVNGANKGSSPYTVTSADVTAGSLTVLQHTSNQQGFSEATSASVNPVGTPTAWSQDLLGGNAGGCTDYSTNQFLNNGGQAGFYPFYAFNNTSAAYSGGLDSNGYPTSACTYLISATSGGLDGQLKNSAGYPGGVYQCSYRSVGQATIVTAFQQCTVSNVTTTNPATGINDGVTTYFQLTIPFAANACLSFNGGWQYLNIPRDGVTQTYGGPEFWATSLAFYAQMSTLRLMDVCRPNFSTEVVWADRLATRTEMGPTQPGVSANYSWERTFRLINAITAYPGSRTKKVGIALPGLIDPAQGNSTNYAYQLATLMNTVFAGNPVEVEVELADEPWNFQFNVAGQNAHNALAEMKGLTLAGVGSVTYSTDGNPLIYSVVSNGDGTATVSLGCSFTGAVSGTTLSYATGYIGTVLVGQTLHGTGVTANTTVTGAPVVVSTGGVTGVAGNSFVAGVSWAATAVVGQVVTLSLMGTSGGTLTTTVAAGSSGTTLNIANPVVTSAAGNSTLTAITAQISTSQTVAIEAMTTGQPVNAVQNPDGSTFAITNGMALVVNNQTLNSSWGAGSIVQNANPLLNAAVTTVNVTVPSPTGNTFSYAINGGVGVTNGTVCPASQMLFIFNSASNLVTDGFSLNLYSIGGKLQTRRLYQVSQVWKTVRPQDKFMMNLQQYTQASSIQPHYPYSQYIAGTTTPWAYASAVAPYVKATASGCVGVAGNAFLTNVPFAATSVVGDTITISGVGASGATLTTTVAAGSSGTTLNIATALSTSNASATITAVSGPQANFTGYIIGTTLTVTSTSSGTVAAGMIFNGTPATMAFGTKILSGSGTSFQVSIAQSVGSAGSPVSMVAANTDGIVGMLQAALPSFAKSLAAHIYQCNLYGPRAMCYEGGTDTQLQPTQQVAINTNPLMGPVLTGLFDAWFSQGGKEFQNYFIAPSAFTNGSQGEWPYLQSFSDLTSPRIAAVLSYATRPLALGSTSASPMLWAPSGTSGAYVEGDTAARPGLSFNTVNGMVYSSSSTADRYIDRMFQVARGRRYNLVLTGSSSAADVLNVTVDGVSAGSITLVANGSGATNGTLPAVSISLPLTLARGSHRIRLDMPAGTCANAGVFSMQLVPY